MTLLGAISRDILSLGSNTVSPSFSPLTLLPVIQTHGC